ncbi:MAG TPA: nuclear transport factor 2 family protein [Usitatibacteraceae bacterium]|nr:nuclear transport factor 2 family protein [Usitatibacteraceae bacterium]
MSTPRIALAWAATAIVLSTGAMAFSALDLAAEEGRFAAHSVRHGMRAAFIAYMAPDALLLRPEPVNAQEFLGPRPDPPIILDWRSQLAAVSASGDLGFSTGPWKRVAKADPAAPPAYGQFFSVWKKQADGTWKVLLDHGISHPQPSLADALLRTVELPKAPALKGDAEGAFADRVRKDGVRAAYRVVAHPLARLLREGVAPLEGAALREALATMPEAVNWEILASGVSAAGDFAYSLSRYSRSGQAPGRGHALRVWVRHEGAWSLLGEVETPLPEPAAR